MYDEVKPIHSCLAWLVHVFVLLLLCSIRLRCTEVIVALVLVFFEFLLFAQLHMQHCALISRYLFLFFIPRMQYWIQFI